MRFIFGLNFAKLNVSLAVEQMDAILAHLPRQAVLAFEVGNEVMVLRLCALLLDVKYLHSAVDKCP